MKTRMVITLFCFVLFMTAKMTSQKSGFAYASDNTKFYVYFSANNISNVSLKDEPAVDYSSLYRFNRKANELFWKIDLCDGQPSLTVMKENGGKQQYQLRFVSQQWQWINSVTGEGRSVDSTIPEKVKGLRDGLVGVWSSSVFSNQVIQDLASTEKTSVMTALLEYDFNANGQFTKTIYLNKEVKSKIQGEWQLSEDGKYVLLQFQDKSGIFYGFSAEIKYFFHDELVLNHPLLNSMDWDAMTEGELHNFFFNKH